MQLERMGKNLLSYTRSGNLSFSKAFLLTQFSFFLFVNNRVFRAVCGFRLSPSPAKLYSQMHQYLLGNHIHWQKKLFAFSEDQVECSGTERWKYLDREAGKKMLFIVVATSCSGPWWLNISKSDCIGVSAVERGIMQGGPLWKAFVKAFS